MKVNFIALSGKILNDNIEIYTKNGKKFNIYTIYLNDKTPIKILYKNKIKQLNQDNVVIFGKIVNICGELGILAIEYKKYK